MPSKKCEADGCTKWASFNLPGLKRPLYCRPHSTDGMVNVVSRQRCTHPDCPKQANFNHPGETRGAFCKEHISEGMVDVRHKHCQHPGCPKQATCNVPGEQGGLFCGQHKLPGMVNVTLKRCAQDGCQTFPSFGHPGQPGVQFCRQHKLPGMTRRTASAGRGGQPAAQDAAAAAAAERCAHPGCCEARPAYCAAHQAEHAHHPQPQQQPQPPQQSQPQPPALGGLLSQTENLQAFAALCQAEQQQQQQEQSEPPGQPHQPQALSDLELPPVLQANGPPQGAGGPQLRSPQASLAQPADGLADVAAAAWQQQQQAQARHELHAGLQRAAEAAEAAFPEGLQSSFVADMAAFEEPPAKRQATAAGHEWCGKLESHTH